MAVFAAWKAGNVVLGGITLILTFCIGIRFLAKPSTERADAETKGAKLDWRGIAISLFFGLTIGFGTGFVGSGGGMMMLVVFTYWELIAAQPLAVSVLWLCQVWSEYDRLFVQKKPGEIKKSLLLLFLCDAALVALCWGVFGLPWVTVAAILMWGGGDGAAALVGHQLGRHHVKLPLADQKKTWEGAGAMLTVSTAVGLVAMLTLTAESWYSCLLMALTASIFRDLYGVDFPGRQRHGDGGQYSGAADTSLSSEVKQLLYEAKMLADQLNLVGWVRNESDGTVVAEIEGQASYICEFLRVMQATPRFSITDIQEERLPLPGIETSFKALYERKLS